MARPDFRPAFGDHPVPQLLDDLGEFAADVKGYFSGRFKLGPEDATAWLGGPAKAREFALFGRDADGSLYGFWLYGDRTPETAPIVYLNAAHEGSTVIANDLPEFLSLLALDITDLGLFYDEGDRPRKHTPGSIAFRTWLLECFGIEPAKHGERIVKRAAAAHPNVEARFPQRAPSA